MTVQEAIKQRRAYRSLTPVEITDETLHELAHAAVLAPTCFNNQPARFVFVRDPEQLEAMKLVYSKGNAWCHAASLVIAVCAEKGDDCVIRDREYYQFDTGLQTALLILRATELGLVAHPIAGYSPKKTRAALGIPDRVAVVTLVLVGRHAGTPSPVLSKEQLASERKRPERLSFDKMAFLERWPAEPEEGG
ncbi:MAG TPA: nitroreductase [candidate division WOR-3 bacterium]|uniref:Nitroreductase n=1 Tax=candidate division WOR-3 bacterium TaxID=2052148 RepID=A0A7V0XEF2_UNCW3|nr:nitroreductase [candidate division WOR-3 bacterium]